MNINYGKKRICLECKKEYIDTRKCMSKQYDGFCNDCVNKKRQEKIKKTAIEKYGSWENFIKFKNEIIKQSVSEKYGSWEEYQNDKGSKIQAGQRKHWDNISDEERKNFGQQKVKTMKEKYGDDFGKKIFEKIKQKGTEKYGSYEEYVKQSHKKRIETLKNKYGKAASPKQIESARNLCASEEFKSKRKQTCLEKYGTEVFWGKCGYKFDDIYFDSSYELYYYIYLKDNNIEFQYHPKSLKYTTADGNQHDYYPDFFTDHYIEIKPSRFYKNGYVLSRNEEEPLVEKSKCIHDNNVEVLTEKELETAFNFVKQKYGSSYVNSFKVGCNWQK